MRWEAGHGGICELLYKLRVSVRGTDSGFTVGKPGRNQVVTTRQTVQEKPSGYIVSWQMTVAETILAAPRGNVSFL